MFRFVVAFAVLAVVAAFGPAGRFGARSLQMTSANKQIAKAFSAAAIAASLAGGLPAFAAEGAGPKYSFFGMGGPDTSSPFVVTENREDPMYSPYSPYGNGVCLCLCVSVSCNSWPPYLHSNIHPHPHPHLPLLPLL